MSFLTLFIITSIGLCLCYFVFDYTDFSKGEIIITPIIGILLGLHYKKHEDEIEFHHTCQFSLILVIITFNWSIEK
jgi:hypothetical protein